MSIHIGYGTDRINGEEAIDLCRHAYDVGYRIFDTALAYGNLESIGKAFNNYADRAKLKIFSKIARPDIEKLTVKVCVEKILTQLNTDYIDILLIHSPKDVDSEHVLSEMRNLQQEKKILTVGVSNYTIKHLEMLKKNGIVPQATQMEIHPYLTENDYVMYCSEHGIEIMSHTSLANGRVMQDPVLIDLAAQQDRTVSQLVLSWLLSRKITPIVGSKNFNNITNNSAKILNTLEPNLCAKINALNINMRICNNPAWSDFD